MLNAEKIIDSLKFSATVADVQKDLFTPAHMLYKCVIVNTANRRRYTFNYQCIPTYSQPSAKECLSCLFSDASAFEYTTDIDDFLKEYGYVDSLENVRKGEKAYKACERTKKALERVFDDDEREAMQEFFSNY